MKALDNPDLFKYQPNKARQEAQASPYINENVVLYRVNPLTNQNDNHGSFIFVLRPIKGATNFLVYKQGATPALNFDLSKAIRWSIQNQIYCSFFDTSNDQWILQFSDPIVAAKVTSTVGILLTCLSTKELSYFDAYNTNGNSISNGDSFKISYYAFPVMNFPRVSDCFSQNSGFKKTLNSSSMCIGLAQGIIGMTPGSTRAIFIPENLLANDKGQKEPNTPQSAVVYVVSLLNVRFASDPVQKSPKSSEKSQPSESDTESKIIIEAPIKEPPSPIQPTKVTIQQSEPEPQIEIEKKTVVVEHEKVEEKKEPELDEFSQKIERIKRLGAVASPFAVMVKPIPKKAEPETKEKSDEIVENEINKPKQTIENEVSASHSRRESPLIKNLVKKIDTLEVELRDKIANIHNFPSTPMSVDEVIKSVSNLAVQLTIHDNEIDTLKKQIADFQNNPTTDTNPKTIDKKGLDTDTLKKQIDIQTKQLKENEEKILALESKMKEKTEKSKQNVTNVIKKLMQSVFEEMGEAFNEDQEYEGEKFSQALFTIFQKQALASMELINQNGVF